MLVFLDAHVAVSKNWLIPLSHTLMQPEHDKAVVYPAVDVIDPQTGKFIKSGNVVGGFDWSLSFRWENVENVENVDTNTARANQKSRGRLPMVTTSSTRSRSDYTPTDTHTHKRTEDDPLASPATPGMFAIKTGFFKYIGGFDTNLKPWGQENIELSLRVWLCGGSIIRQPCARVAHKYDHLFEAATASAGNSISSSSVDKNVLSVAEHWFGQEYKEIVHKARFTGRVPYTVEVTQDARMPKQFKYTAPVVNGDCQKIDWYLTEVYPGLLSDIPTVEKDYLAYVHSDYLGDALSPVLTQYKGIHDEEHLVRFPNNPLLSQRSLTREEVRLQTNRDRLIPSAAYSGRRARGRKSAPKPLEIFHSDPHGDPHEVHANMIRESMQVGLV